jgi:hypothetical protein
LSHEVRATARDTAERIVDAALPISVYAAPEWDSFDEDGHEWLAAIVLETQRSAAVGVFDITKPINARQDGLLAIDVLQRFNTGKGPFVLADANRIIEAIRGMVLRLQADQETIAFLEGDRMAIVAERNEAQETIRDLRAKLIHLEGADAAGSQLAFDATCDQVRALLRPSHIDALSKRDTASLNPAELAELALWQTDVEGRAIRFVAELATMTDTECDFVEGRDLRLLARLLQVPGDETPTVPRYYSEQDRKRAQDALIGSPCLTVERRGSYYRAVLTATGIDLVAEALGMRRAGA